MRKSETESPGSSVRAIAFYLPQYHPIPENDLWWGKGFTEWTNVAKAKPLFRGHYQPHVPADLGFYDLRVPETREAQAAMARQYGIEAFCYWHYWFGNGVRILERVFEEVLTSGSPAFPFCLGWANETWTGVWHGAPNRILMEQKYPGAEDYRRHFDFLLRAFGDPRYVRVEGKPLFLVYRPQHIPECRKAMEFWRELAAKNGLPGLHLVAQAPEAQWNPAEHGFDAATLSWGQLGPYRLGQRVRRRLEANSVTEPVIKRLIRKPFHVYPYQAVVSRTIVRNLPWQYYPMAISNWDNTPRSGHNGVVLVDSSPELFRLHLRAAIATVQGCTEERRIVFLKSWNEWAEGNHLEPDRKFGHAYLEAVRDELLAASTAESPVESTCRTPTEILRSHTA